MASPRPTERGARSEGEYLPRIQFGAPRGCGCGGCGGARRREFPRARARQLAERRRRAGPATLRPPAPAPAHALVGLGPRPRSRVPHGHRACRAPAPRAVRGGRQARRERRCSGRGHCREARPGGEGLRVGCSAGPSASGEARRGAMPAVRPPHGAPEASGNGADAGAAQPVGGLEALVVGKGLGGTSGAGGSDGCGGTRRRRAREARTHARPLEEVRSAPNVGAPGKGHVSKGHASTADGRRTQPLAAPDLWVENSLPVMGVHPSKGRRRVQSAQPTTHAACVRRAHRPADGGCLLTLHELQEWSYAHGSAG